MAEIPTSAGASTRATSQPPPAKAKRIETTAGHDTTDQAGQPTIIAALDSAATGLTSGQDAFARLPECADSIGPHGAVFRVGCAPEGREAGILVISIANAASLSERLLSPSTRPSPTLMASRSTCLRPNQRPESSSQLLSSASANWYSMGLRKSSSASMVHTSSIRSLDTTFLCRSTWKTYRQMQREKRN